MAKILPFVLKRLRTLKGLSQEALAERAQINKQTVFRLEQEPGSQTNTREHIIQSVAKALNTDPNVLTGQAPLPDVPVDIPGDQSRLKFATSWFAQNALYLVSKRYDVSQKHIVELAPFLFCCIAEASLRQRRERLQQAQSAYEQAKAVHNEISHLLSGPDISSAEEQLSEEQRSINICDLFGMLVEDGSISGDETQNPFAVYLAQLADNTNGIAEAFSCAWGSWPEYRVCAEAIEDLAGNDSELAEYIHEGHIALNEIPREIHDAKEQTQWLSAKKEEFDRKRNPHLYDQRPDGEPSP